MTVRKVRGLIAGLSVIASAGSVLTADPPPSGKYWVYVGTYTGGKAGSKGIYRCELDLATGKLSAPEVAAEMTNPSFVTLAPDGKTLYAVGEVSGTGPNGGGVITALRVDPATGKLTQIDSQPSHGAGPCHVTTDLSGQLLVVANYSGGSWKLCHLKPDGSLTDYARMIELTGSGPNKQRQEKPHAHCAAFNKSGDVFYVVDLGSDRVWPYRVKLAEPVADGGQADVKRLPAIKFPPGSGPRHIHINKAGDVAYVNGELDNTVNVVKLDAATGSGEVVQTLSTLPGGKPVAGNSTAEVRIHPSGKFVYVSNRGHDSIAVFSVDPATGKLAVAGHATSPDVKTPRNFNIDPTGKWMLVASQDGDNVAAFAVDPETGMPKPTGDKVAVGRPVCVKFLAKP